MSEVTETRAAHTKYQTPRRWTACARDKNRPTRFWTTSHPPETKVPGAHAPPLDVAVWTPAVDGLEPVSDGSLSERPGVGGDCRTNGGMDSFFHQTKLVELE